MSEGGKKKTHMERLFMQLKKDGHPGSPDFEPKKLDKP
jgi:hypothetical protein